MTHSLRIWAPLAREVSVVIDGRAQPAQALSDGYFSAGAPPDGADYFVRIDGRDRPDPRSRHQPAGVSGPSRAYHDRFVWSDQGFRACPLGEALIYEMHIGTFTPEGTYAAAAEHLDHLEAIGVTHLELLPVATFPGRFGWGYDGVGLFAPHPSYGTPDDLKRFVATCHARGFAVLLDVVYNHLGPDGNYLGELGPYFTTRYQTPWGQAVNLDGADSDHVRRFFCDNALMWLEEYHFDGLRLDAVHALFDESPQHFLAQLSTEVRALGERLNKPLVLIAESDRNDPKFLWPIERGGFGLDAQWSDDFHHALHAVLTGETNGYYSDFGMLEDVARALRDGFVYAGRYSSFRKRRHGAPLGDLSGHRLLGYLQTHDQIGNRARGERLGQLTTPARAGIGAALLFVSPFVPMLFQGEEWSASSPFLYFADHQDPGLADAVRRGRREEFAAFGWQPEQVPDPIAEETYRRSVLDWAERERAPHRDVLRWYTALGQLRRELPELRDGERDRLAVRCDEAHGVISVERGGLTLQANLSKQPVTLERPKGTLRLYCEKAPLLTDHDVELGPESCAIFVATPVLAKALRGEPVDQADDIKAITRLAFSQASADR
jgi:maltooligosyltrehalose trehalohydrolase